MLPREQAVCCKPASVGKFLLFLNRPMKTGPSPALRESKRRPVSGRNLGGTTEASLRPNLDEGFLFFEKEERSDEMDWIK